MHIQMARELGLNPKKFGSLDNHHQQQWKVPLPQFIENIYFKSFKKEAPDQVVSIEAKIKADKARAEKKKKEKAKRRALKAAEEKNAQSAQKTVQQ